MQIVFWKYIINENKFYFMLVGSPLQSRNDTQAWLFPFIFVARPFSVLEDTRRSPFIFNKDIILPN